MNVLRYLMLVAFFLFLSCNENIVISEFDGDFNNNRWLTSEVKSFHVALESDVENSNLQLHFSHIYDFQFQYVPFEVTITYPDGRKEVVPMNVKIKDDNGKDLADCSGDICDLHTIIKENVNFKKGKYTFQIKNGFNGQFLPNVLGIGILAEKK